MFPLADARGQVLGFGARQMAEGRGPKYLNTSENDLYHKGRQLFGIDVARKEAMKTGRFVVVEGYTDVLALHQAGIREAVAIMGTAMTQEQLAELAKVGDSNRRGAVFLALDADRAGREAMLRAARLAEDRGVDLRVVDMPEGTDPADLVSADGADAFMERMDRAAPMIEFQVRRVLADADLDTPSGRDRALRGGAGADLRRARTHRNKGRARPRGRGPPRRSRGLRAGSAGPPSGRQRARRPAPAQASPGELAFAQNASFLRAACRAGPSDATILRGLPMTSSPRTSSAARAITLSRTSTTRSPTCPRTTPRSALSSRTWRSRRRSCPPTEELVLRMSILQLEQRRIEREIKRASQERRPRPQERAGRRRAARA